MNLSSTNAEATILMEEMQITIKELQESEFYLKILDQLQNNQSIQNQIKRVIGPNSKFQMVIYALGSIELNYKSQFQLSLAILLKQDFPCLIEGIEVYDPVTSPNDAKVMEELGCKVLSINEYCRRKIENPTLFFMPSPNHEQIGNLLEANWCPNRLNQIILLTNNFQGVVDGLNDSAEIDENVKERLDYIKAVLNHTIAFEIHGDEFNYSNPFYSIAWHFFDFCPQIHMDSLLPDNPSKEKRLEMRLKREKENDLFPGNLSLERIMSHIMEMAAVPFEVYIDDYILTRDDWSIVYNMFRCPSRLRSSWLPPYTGWVKLNFSGKGSDGVTQAGYAGTFHDEHKMCLAVYAGPLNDADPTFANAEALRQGLRCLKNLSFITKLVVEGDDLSVIRWANGGIDPPERLREAFYDIRGVFLRIDCVMLHVYKEANKVAIELAKKGTEFLDHRFWVNP